MKVTDFGIARAGGASEGLTQTGSVMGTATYFSPEQAQGLPVDARSDVYSLGVVLYEMVCAVPPFSGDSPIAVAYKHVREEPPRPTVVNPDVPRELEEIILTALGKTPEERYPSADDMRADLARFRRGEQPNVVPSQVVAAVPVSGTDLTTVSPKAAVDRTRMETIVRPPPPKKRSAWPFVLALVALLGVLAGLGYLLADQLQGDGGGGDITVQDYVGLTLSEANLLLERAGLEATPTFEINDNVPENQVFKQDPPEGTKLEKGDEVKLTVSEGRGKFPVPDVAGKSVEDAESVLQDAGFDVDVRQEVSETVEKGKVVRTDPAANMEVERGSEVTVFESAGVELVAVPDVTGQDAVSAANQLGSAGFKVERVTEPSDTVEADTVIRTDPAAGTEAPKGSTVRLVVSSGAEEVRVPSVVGLTQSEATAVLEDAGFQVATQDVTTLDATRGRAGHLPEPAVRHPGGPGLHGHDHDRPLGRGDHDHLERFPDHDDHGNLRLTAGLATWYAAHGRHQLPWRATRDRWGVLVSEVMLAQTQVGRVAGVWEPFMARFPTPDAMASAAAGDVIAVWGNLGYPRRARRLWEAAVAVAGSGWPDDLAVLPGVGRYTADAVAAQVDDRDTAAIETNVRRVVERRAGRRLTPAEAAAASRDAGRPLAGRDRLLALMDVGGVLCRPRAPRCPECPLAVGCATAAEPGLLSAGVGRPVRRQPRYEGSFRQRRGVVLAALRSGPVAVAELDGAALEGLVADGLAVVDGSAARLP